MIREIVIYGDPVLRKKCAPVTEVSDETNALVTDMLETMKEAEGVGLAAPQIGIPIQLAVVDVSHDPECITYLRVDGKDAALEDVMPLIFINPELEFGPDKVRGTEGCLSIPELRSEVNRPETLKARLPQLDGSVLEIECDGLLARAVQHEVDHLNGVLFIDRLSAAAKVSLRGKLKRIARGEY